MVTKKNVFVMVLVFLMVAGIVSAGAIGRGGFGAGAVVTAAAADDSTVRPVQRWQGLDTDELATCPCIGADGEFDREAFASWQAERAVWREDVQSQSMRNTMGRQGKAATPVASYGQNRAPVASYGQNRAPVASYGQNRAQAVSYGQNRAPVASYGQNWSPMQGRAVNTRPGMGNVQPAGGASYGPAWAR